MSVLATKQAMAVPQETTLVQAYVALTKLRISVMVLFTFAVAAILAAHSAEVAHDLNPEIFPKIELKFGAFFGAVLGMLMIACSGNAMNMYLERYTDFLMARTSRRPLPAQRLSATAVATFAAITFGIGVSLLFATVNWEVGACGIANWILYVFIYTPLKRKTHFNTEIGAVAGAMPVVMGALAATGTVGVIGWSFFGVLFLWQFPHFMAIAWIYRDDYRDGGMKMLTVTEPTGAAAGRKSVVTAVLLIGVSLVPVVTMRTEIHGWVFGIVAVLLGLVYLHASIAFARSREEPSPRYLLRVSLLYLPIYMLVLVIACLT